VQEIISSIRKDERKLINAVLIMAKARNAVDYGQAAIKCRKTNLAFKDNTLF
jgi:hypothetical protein